MPTPPESSLRWRKSSRQSERMRRHWRLRWAGLCIIKDFEDGTIADGLAETIPALRGSPYIVFAAMVSTAEIAPMVTSAVMEPMDTGGTRLFNVSEALFQIRKSLDVTLKKKLDEAVQRGHIDPL